MQFYRIDSKKHDLLKIEESIYNAEMQRLKGSLSKDEWKFIRHRLPVVLPYRMYDSFDKIVADLLSARALGKATTKQKMILRYGQNEGLRRWDNYVNLQSVTNTFEYKHKKYGMTYDEFAAYNKSRACTLANFIERHGQEAGQLMWDSYCETQKTAGVTLCYFIEKYGEERGKAEYAHVNSQKAITLDNFVRKYGSDEGKIRYATVMENAFAYASHKSKIATDFISALVGAIGATEYYGGDNKEFSIYDDDTKRIYFYDFKVKGSKKIVEFNGDYWHANPNKYLAEDEIKYPSGVKLAADVWACDAIKHNVALKNGYTIYTVWQTCYNESPNEEIERVTQWLNS